ncbi:MAG TPA: outer membrane beta-barrel protein [Gemmatimonadales bacterium]|nr:outer membrane beta-barrel protein [Gemmatimonadales bacterium]
MTRQLVGLFGALALACAANPASAQVLGIPVYNGGVPSGIGIGIDVAFPNDDLGDGTAYGVRGMVGLGPLGLTASLAQFNPKGDGDNVTSVGGTANLKVFGGPLVPVSVTLQGGVGFWSRETLLGDVNTLHVPLGVGVGVSIPNPALAIRPWVAPRLDIVRVDGDLGDAETETNFGFSLGVDFNTLSGLGLHAIYDWVSADDLKPQSIGFGAHYAFRVPGL